MMNPAEFANIKAAEQRLWWYRGMRRILFGVLNPWLRGRQVRRVLEAGCGTGYFARVLGEEHGWTVYPSDRPRDGCRTAVASRSSRVAVSIRGF
jgi:protein-L-isoaspartate O-methyltransferase